MKKWLLALVFVVTIPAHAGFMTGNELYELYKASIRAGQASASDKDFRDANEYLGYVTGVWDTLEGFAVCTGDNITRGQIGDMVGEYLRSNPSIRDKQASSIIMIYLNSKYPCKK
ncbi:Rap1a/Tai family immunity protein [Raoultella planticola]|jgi:hypothetical protein|uniref:Rap1a/Tai family immunity protein n=1 Tax=Raoultella planticola TaxID=575 RepID=UPI001F532C80|nr:Rap1a/Tai family immunity protein [Raoultella planticola]UNK76072.1 hypothetical protein MNO12_05765 [Raoultella planticola]DAY90350.1 MAG TPA: Tai4 [Caudoviricetes sp.]